jgi:hypothetical protein
MKNISIMKRYSLIILLLASLTISVSIDAQTIINTYNLDRSRTAATRGGTATRLYSPTQQGQDDQRGQNTSTYRGLGGSRYGSQLGVPSDFGSGNNGSQQGGYAGYDMHSTTVMPGSGSRYRSELTDVGASTIGDGPRRIGGGNSGGGTGPENPDDPFATPIGSLPIALMLLLAMGYGFRLYRRSRHPAIPRFRDLVIS